MSKWPTISVTPGQRFATGCIATLTDGSAQHFAGEGAAATRAVADYCDAHGCKIVCLSTPMTIYRDLVGGARGAGDRNPYRSDSLLAHDSDDLMVPERTMLTRIGRLDLLADRKEPWQH